MAPRQLAHLDLRLPFVYAPQQEVSLSTNDQKRLRPYGAFLIVGGWLLIRSASASNRLIPRRSALLRSGSLAVFSSEAVASSCRCTSAKSSLLMIALSRFLTFSGVLMVSVRQLVTLIGRTLFTVRAHHPQTAFGKLRFGRPNGVIRCPGRQIYFVAGE